MRTVCRRILCYGDSNTYGYDPRSYLGARYPETIRWTALLEQREWTVFNEGENGRSIPQRKWEIDAVFQMIRHLDPDIMLVMLGSNDLLQSIDISAEDCAARMEEFLEHLLGQRPPYSFLLIAPPPMTIGAWVGDDRTVEASRRLSECYQSAAQRLGIYFADAGDWKIDLAYDGVHFSEAGHMAFAKGVDQVLNDIEANVSQEGPLCLADVRNQ